MEFLQGRHHWWGAELARDEVNAAGGVKVGDETYMIELIKADSNEIISIIDAAAAMEKLITVDGADFVIGGFRTEAVFPMQEIAMDYKKVFINCGAADLALNTPVLEDYERYKYYFRGTPFCNNHLVANTLYEISMVGAILKEETGIKRPLRVAICAEGAQWADNMVNIMNALIPSRLGMEVVGTWRPSPTATELTAEMTAMEDANTDIIVTVISGPLGIPYARSWGELEVPAASVGINVESTKLGFWDATKGFGNYETSLGSYAEGLSISPKTKPFVDAFIEKYGELPTYTAATYDVVLGFVEDIEKAGTLDADTLVPIMENIDRITTGGRFVFTGMDAPLRNPHDVTYGPGYATGIAVQWQDGELVAVWPNPDYAADEDWKTVEYEGVVKWKAPPRVIDKLKAEAAAEPEEVVPPEEPAAPSEGPSFKAATYANDEYGFSVQYPANWVERADLMTLPEHLAFYSVPGFVPGIAIEVVEADEPVTADWLVESYTSLGNEKFELLSDLKEITLADGTKALTYKGGYVSATGYDIESFGLDADKDGNRIRIVVFTVPAFSPYDEALFSEIAQTLRFE